MLIRTLRYLLASLLVLICLDVSLKAQQPYELQKSDPLEDRWRWQRMDALGSHNRRIVVHESGKALIQKKRPPHLRYFMFFVP